MLPEASYPRQKLLQPQQEAEPDIEGAPELMPLPNSSSRAQCLPDLHEGLVLLLVAVLAEGAREETHQSRDQRSWTLLLPGVRSSCAETLGTHWSVGAQVLSSAQNQAGTQLPSLVQPPSMVHAACGLRQTQLQCPGPVSARAQGRESCTLAGGS